MFPEFNSKQMKGLIQLGIVLMALCGSNVVSALNCSILIGTGWTPVSIIECTPDLVHGGFVNDGKCSAHCLCTHGAPGGGNCLTNPNPLQHPYCVCDYTVPSTALDTSTCSTADPFYSAGMQLCTESGMEQGGPAVCDSDCQCVHKGVSGTCTPNNPSIPRTPYCTCAYWIQTLALSHYHAIN